ncbi:hypothetical protein JW916_15480 [Candidatus Sumerlaeota bacterium]|nr:hypothetical protein [Candidatus Sumerlaeota bacterium]
MSTILDALRKAKDAPHSEPVDARREILRPQTHDYLASVPDAPSERTIAFKSLIGLAILTIVALAAVVLVLAVKLSRSETGPETQPALAQSTPTLEPSLSPTDPPTPQSLSAPDVGSGDAASMAMAAPPSPVPLEPVATPPPVATPVRPAQPTPAAARRAQRRSNRGPGAALDGVKIDGVFWDEQDPAVLIDGKMMKIGSRIGKAKIVRIRRDSSVVFEIDGKHYTVK